MFRSADPSVTPDELRALAREVRDWARALQMAEREGATSAIWSAFREDHAGLPDEAVTFLRARTMMSDFRMARLSARLAETLAVFRERDIPVMLLKGAAVGAMADPSFRARPMTDVDMLVKQEDAPRAREAVFAAGWTQLSDERLHLLLQDMHHEVPFKDAQLPGLRLELHTQLLPPDQPFAFHVHELWDESRAAPAPFSGARLPAPEYLLFHASVHFAWQHQMEFGTWRTMRTVGTVLRRSDIQWSAALDLALRTKAGTSCYWTLWLAAQLSQLECPPAILSRCAPAARPLSRRVLERFVLSRAAPGELPTSPSERVSGFLWRAAIGPEGSGVEAHDRAEADHEWARAMGKFRPDTLGQRLRRHLSSAREWASFVRYTLLGR